MHRQLIVDLRHAVRLFNYCFNGDAIFVAGDGTFEYNLALIDVYVDVGVASRDQARFDIGQ